MAQSITCYIRKLHDLGSIPSSRLAAPSRPLNIRSRRELLQLRSAGSHLTINELTMFIEASFSNSCTLPCASNRLPYTTVRLGNNASSVNCAKLNVQKLSFQAVFAKLRLHNSSNYDSSPSAQSVECTDTTPKVSGFEHRSLQLVIKPFKGSEQREKGNEIDNDDDDDGGGDDDDDEYIFMSLPLMI